MTKEDKKGDWEELVQHLRSREPNTSEAEIEERILHLFGEKLCILFTDLTGFSERVKTRGVVSLLDLILRVKETITPSVEQHGGEILKQIGDSLLLVFEKPKAAVDCAIAMQARIEEMNQGKAPAEHVGLCIGMGFSPVIRLDSDVFGLEVNYASKLGEDIAQAKEILITKDLYDEISGSASLAFAPCSDIAIEAFRILY